MAIVVKTNKNTSLSRRWIVRSVFFGHTPAERANWKVTVNAPITFSNSGTISYNYLRLKNDESPNVFNRLFYEVKIEAGKAYVLNLVDVTPFSLSITSGNALLQSEVISKLINGTSVGQLPKLLFLNELSNTIANWIGIDSANTPIAPPVAPFTHNGNTYQSINVSLLSTQSFKVIPLHKLYPATNNIWNQQGLLQAGINDVDDNKYYKGDDHVFDRFFKLTPDTTDLDNDFEVSTMPTNPYTLEIHKALQAQNYLVESGTTVPANPHYLDWHIKNRQGEESEKVADIWNALEAGKYGIDNETDPNNPVSRKWNLGAMLENVARVLGLRRTAEGKIDRNLERKLYLPATLNNPTLKGDKYSTNAFGDLGLMIPHLPTAYTKRGGATELWDVVSDLPQLIQAVLRQLDVSLGIQHGSEIRTRSTTTGKIVCYPNQLSMLLEMERKISVIEAHTNKTYITTLVTSNEVRALFSGIGIPVTQRSIPLVGQGKTLSLPYFSHQKNQPSIASRLNGLEINIGIINGVLMPKAQSPENSVFNPFSLFTGKSQS